MSPLGNKIAFFRYKYNIDIINDNLQTINTKIISFSGLDVTIISPVQIMQFFVLKMAYGILMDLLQMI